MPSIPSSSSTAKLGGATLARPQRNDSTNVTTSNNNNSTTVNNQPFGAPYALLKPNQQQQQQQLGPNNQSASAANTNANNTSSKEELGRNSANNEDNGLYVADGGGGAGGGVGFFDSDEPTLTLQQQTRKGFDIIEKAWPYVHAVARIPNKGSCILISLPDEHNTPKNGDPSHHGILLTTSFVLRSAEEAAAESAIFLEEPVAGTYGKWPNCPPIDVKLRPDKFYSSSVNHRAGEVAAAGADASSVDDDEETLGYTVVACNLSAEANPHNTIGGGKINPLPLPIIVSKIPEVSVGDTHLFVTHNDGRSLAYQVGIVKEVHPHHCVYTHTRTESILSSGGPVFTSSGEFIGIQHQCGDNSFCILIRSLIIHLFDSAMLGPCRVSLWDDEDDVAWELRKGVYASYHETYNRNMLNPNAAHSSNYTRMPSAATTYGGLPSQHSNTSPLRNSRRPLLLQSNANTNTSGTTTTNKSGTADDAAFDDSAAAALVAYSSNVTSFTQQQQSIYDPNEAASQDAKPTWMARQRLRDVGECGAQLVDYDEFSRFTKWSEKRAKLPESFVPRTAREVWAEWYTDYQSLILLLHAFPYNETIALLALQELTSSQHRTSIQTVASLGGIGIILHTLDLHPFSEKLMLAGVTALARLSLTSANKHAIAKCDGIAVLIAIMYEWSSNHEIQQWATYSLLNLTQDYLKAAECVRSIVKLQGVERIIANMRTFPSAKHLIRWSSILLVNILRGGSEVGVVGAGGGTTTASTAVAAASHIGGLPVENDAHFNYGVYGEDYFAPVLETADGSGDDDHDGEGRGNQPYRHREKEGEEEGGSGAAKRKDTADALDAALALMKGGGGGGADADATSSKQKAGGNNESSGGGDDAALPSFVVEAWSIVLAPIIISENGDAADADGDAYVSGTDRSRAAAQQKGASSPSSSSVTKTTTTAEIDLLPLLWRLLYAHKNDAFALYGLSNLLRELICACPQAIAEKIKARNTAAMTAAQLSIGGVKTIEQKTRELYAPDRVKPVRKGSSQQHQSGGGGLGGQRGTAVFMPLAANADGQTSFASLSGQMRQQSNSSSSSPSPAMVLCTIRRAPIPPPRTYTDAHPLFHLPISYFTHTGALLEANRRAFPILLPHNVVYEEGHAESGEGSGGGDDNSRADGTSPSKLNQKHVGGRGGVVSERELRLRRMPDVPAFLPSNYSGGGFGGGGGEATAEDPFYFISLFDVLAEMLIFHGLRHIKKARTPAEEDAYHDEIRRLITGQERVEEFNEEVLANITATTTAATATATTGTTSEGITNKSGMSNAPVPLNNGNTNMSLVTPATAATATTATSSASPLLITDKEDKPALRWGLVDSRCRVMRLVLGEYDLLLNKEHYRMGRSHNNKKNKNKNSDTIEKSREIERLRRQREEEEAQKKKREQKEKEAMAFRKSLMVSGDVSAADLLNTSAPLKAIMSGGSGGDDKNTATTTADKDDAINNNYQANSSSPASSDKVDAAAASAVNSSIHDNSVFTSTTSEKNAIPKGEAYSPNTLTASSSSSPKQSSGDASDRADSELLCYLLQCLIAVVTAAERKGLVRKDLVTQAMVEQPTTMGGGTDDGNTINNKNTAVVGGSGSNSTSVTTPPQNSSSYSSPNMTANTNSSNSTAVSILKKQQQQAAVISHPPSLALEAVLVLHLPIVLIEIAYYHISETVLHDFVKRLLVAFGCEKMLSEAAYPFLYHSTIDGDKKK